MTYFDIYAKKDIILVKVIKLEKLKVGDQLQIQCYKHDGQIHRSWDEAVVLDIKRNYIVLLE